MLSSFALTSLTSCDLAHTTREHQSRAQKSKSATWDLAQSVSVGVRNAKGKKGGCALDLRIRSPPIP
eukprot:2484642-Rhodomonas_salina.2